MCPLMWAHWRHLANTTEPSVCGGNAVLCQITLTTCLDDEETAEPIDLLYGLWTLVSQRKHKYNHIREVAPMCPLMWTHWRHLANTIEMTLPLANPSA